jgi:hypothetical protein
MRGELAGAQDHCLAGRRQAGREAICEVGGRDGAAEAHDRDPACRLPLADRRSVLGQLAAERTAERQRELLIGGDQLLEFVASQPPEVTVALRANRSGPGSARQGGQLTDHRAPAHRADDLTVTDDVHAARLDDVGAVRLIPFVK